MTIYNIPASVPFLPSLVTGLNARYGTDDPTAFAQMQIFVPTRRAAQSLRAEFLHQSEHKALILPRILALGDVDPVDFDLPFYTDLPPAMHPLRRSLLLADLIQKRSARAIPHDHALHLAFALAALMDEMITSGASWDNLATIVPDEFAAHWSITLDLLATVIEDWPKILAAENKIDPTTRRNLLIQKQVNAWQQKPARYPVIAAGSMGEIPASSRLLCAINELPNGIVILPGLDPVLDNDSFASLHEAHPQYAMQQWLTRAKITRDQVHPWCETPQSAHDDLWREAMRPALQDYSVAKPSFHNALDQLAVIEAAGTQDEAEIVALRVREILQSPDLTAMIVTPDRTLAHRIKAALLRYEISLNDSAGHSLAESPVGNLFDLSGRIVLDDFIGVTLLAFLKHPLVALGFAPSAVRSAARAFEIATLRGPRIPDGLQGLIPHIAADNNILLRFVALFTSWNEQSRSNVIRPFKDWLNDHILLVQSLAATDSENGEARLWRGDDGESAVELLRILMKSAPLEFTMNFSDYHALLMDFVTRHTVRARFGTHPRIRLLSPVESRLQHADIVILAGLNEVIWPESDPADPWLSRMMRKQIGLPTFDYHIGIAAHDFVQAASGPHVFLTRAQKESNAPSTRSRWLERLYITLHATSQWHEIDRTACWSAWRAELDRPDSIKQIAQPRPTPPVPVRPRKLSVSAVELWRRDPYSLYARAILKLNALPNLSEDPDARLYGQIVHSALEQFFQLFSSRNDIDHLRDLGFAEFSKAGLDAHPLMPFWREKWIKACAWIGVQIQRLQNDHARIAGIECSGTMIMPAPAGAITIHGRADRIDRESDGSLVVVDYKTGRAPSKKELELGYAPQLPLLALIANRGGFSTIEKSPVTGVQYWDFIKAAEPKPLNLDDVYQDLLRWLSLFDQEDTAYIAVPHADYAPRYGDYQHLARTREWSLSQGDAE